MRDNTPGRTGEGVPRSGERPCGTYAPVRGLDVEVAIGVALDQERQHGVLQLARRDRIRHRLLGQAMVQQLGAEPRGMDLGVTACLRQAAVRLGLHCPSFT